MEATSQIAEGPKPILVKFSSREREMSWVVQQAIDRGKIASAVIVCRNWTDISAFSQALRVQGCNAVEINKDTPGYANEKEVYLTTYHSVKGMEFDHVFIPNLTEDKLPDPDVVSRAVSKEDAYADEIKLLYVAVTRSRYGLYMTFNGTLSSLFPVDSDRYDFYGEENL